MKVRASVKPMCERCRVIKRHGKTLVINPGEACGYLTGTSTIALLDTGTAEARLISL